MIKYRWIEIFTYILIIERSDKMLKTILAILQGATEEMTAEELRRLIADAVEEVNDISINVEAVANERDTLKTENASQLTEIERLKEENGRLFKKFLRQQEEVKEPATQEKNIDEIIENLEKEIDYFLEL